MERRERRRGGGGGGGGGALEWGQVSGDDMTIAAGGGRGARRGSTARRGRSTGARTLRETSGVNKLGLGVSEEWGWKCGQKNVRIGQ
eukprot:256638-Hanusia_phi.AAC.1